MSPTHDERGKFAKGNKLGKGRPKREVERGYLKCMLECVTEDDWREVVMTALRQAKRGDAYARNWLSDYLIGKPVQRTEMTGENGGPLEVSITRFHVLMKQVYGDG